MTLTLSDVYTGKNYESIQQLTSLAKMFFKIYKSTHTVSSFPGMI